MIPDARILTAARKYGGEAYRRWDALRGDINTKVIDEDALGLKGPNVATDGGYTPGFTQSKEQEFLNWLDQRMRSGVLEPVGDRELLRGGHWSGKWVRSARDGGVRDGGTRLREAGGTPNLGRDEIATFFDLPVARDQIQRLYRRDFTELKGVTDHMSRVFSRELADGLSQGENPRKIARRLNDRIEHVGMVRSRTIARYELSHSYNRGAILRYERNAIEKANVVNTSPCKEICAPKIAGNPYTLDELKADGPPYHPNCRGAVSPVVPGASP